MSIVKEQYSDYIQSIEDAVDRVVDNMDMLIVHLVCNLRHQ